MSEKSRRAEPWALERVPRVPGDTWSVSGRELLMIHPALALMDCCTLTFSRAHMAVARLRSETMPHAAATSIINLVGLNCVAMPYSEAA
eukprot:6178726-Pleurochrysis_carterae.AAC.2